MTLPVLKIFEEPYLRVRFMARDLQSQNGHIKLNAKKVILTNLQQYLEHLNFNRSSN